MQQPDTASAVHGTQQRGQRSRSSSLVEVISSSPYAGSPLEAFGDIPPSQDPCIVEHTSAFIDTLARARIIAVMSMNIFVYDKPLNAHRDRWVCPFSNCKQSFLDPKTMMSHAAYCTHISASGAYCNCCGCYYDFPGQNPAFLTRAGDSAPPVAKDSAITKGRRKIHKLLSRHSGSASSSREQLPSKASSSFSADSGMDSLLASRKGSIVSNFSTTGCSSGHQPSEGPAELGADYQIVEIGNSSILPSRCDFSPSTDSHMTQPLAQLRVSTMSTTNFIEPMVPDYGDFCMSPTEYSPGDNHCMATQQSSNGSVSYTTSEDSLHTAQQPRDVDQSFSWNVDVGHMVAEGITFGQVPVTSQESQGLMVNVPNFSRPRLSLQVRQDGEISSSHSHHPFQREDMIPGAMTDFQHHYGDFFGHSHLAPAEQGLFGIGIADGNVQPFQITEGHLGTTSISAGTRPRFSNFNQGDDEELSCPACDYRPRGAKAYRRANLNKHWKNKHEKTTPWICRKCGIPCKRKDNLQVHVQKVCGKTKPPRPPRFDRRKHVVRSVQAGTALRVIP
jgi:hypothetical protein